jgi:hypothetical protein
LELQVSNNKLPPQRKFNGEIAIRLARRDVFLKFVQSVQLVLQFVLAFCVAIVLQKIS